MILGCIPQWDSLLAAIVIVLCIVIPYAKNVYYKKLAERISKQCKRRYYGNVVHLFYKNKCKDNILQRGSK